MGDKGEPQPGSSVSVLLVKRVAIDRRVCVCASRIFVSYRPSCVCVCVVSLYKETVSRHVEGGQ